MLSDVLEGAKFMGIALMKPGWESEHEPYPAHEVMGVGFVKVAVNHPDGTSHIVLKGIARARIEHYLAFSPYRRAEIQELPDIAENASKVEALREELLGCLREVRSEVELRELAQDLFQKPAPELADFVAFHSSLNPEEKQALLQELRVDRRLYALIQGVKK